MNAPFNSNHLYSSQEGKYAGTSVVGVYMDSRPSKEVNIQLPELTNRMTKKEQHIEGTAQIKKDVLAR